MAERKTVTLILAGIAGAAVLGLASLLPATQRQPQEIKLIPQNPTPTEPGGMYWRCTNGEGIAYQEPNLTWTFRDEHDQVIINGTDYQTAVAQCGDQLAPTNTPQPVDYDPQYPNCLGDKTAVWDDEGKIVVVEFDGNYVRQPAYTEQDVLNFCSSDDIQNTPTPVMQNSQEDQSCKRKSVIIGPGGSEVVCLD